MDSRQAQRSPDPIDGIIEDWRRERPDLDLSPMHIFARLGQVARLVETSVEQVLAHHQLRMGEFDVLAALRRSGPPFTLTPSALSTAVMMSRTGMTSLLDRLETGGLVARSLDPADRRSFQVILTDSGRQVIDATLTDHAANLRRLAAQLGPDDTATLTRILRHLLDVQRLER
jgi:DNA-binding MarR family transcriptional regulator